MPKVGLLGSLVWDLIYGRDPASAPVEEWGGIAYALAGLDASVAPGWEIVPLIKVGQDLAGKAQEFLRGLDHLAPGARCVEVPAPNNRVVLHYYSSERRRIYLEITTPIATGFKQQLAESDPEKRAANTARMRAMAEDPSIASSTHLAELLLGRPLPA